MTLSKFKNHPNYNCEITLDSGEQFKIYANWMHNEQQDNFQGWHCNAGLTRFYIDKNFNVWDGECKNTLLGNALGEWNTNPDNICKRPTCTGCTDDLIVSKHKNARS
jgi:hypothetical protein